MPFLLLAPALLFVGGAVVGSTVTAEQAETQYKSQLATLAIGAAALWYFVLRK